MHRFSVQTALAAAALVTAACVLRLPALDMPLNRDESTYALIGDQGSLQLLPYRDFFDNKQPLIYVVYWMLAQVAPQTVGAVRLTAALLAGAAALALMAMLAPRIGPARAGAAAATALIAGTSTFVEGYDLNAEHLLIVTGTATILLALHLGPSTDRRAPLLVGLLGGFAVLTKAVFGLSAAAALVPLLAGRRARGQSAAATVALLAAGFATAPLAVFAVFAAAGAGPDFWEGNVMWNLRYATGADGHFELPARLVPLAVLAGASLAVGTARLWRLRGHDVLGATLLVWLIAACLGAISGGREFPHYYAPIVPPAAALLWLPWPQRQGGRAHPLAVAAPVVLAVAVALPFARDVGRGFAGGGGALSARQYGAGFAALWGQQFDVGRRLRRLARAGDRLFVAGAEPGFNLFSGIAPPTPHFFLFEYPDVPPAWVAETRRGVCEQPPRFIILPWGRPLDERCAPRGRYRELLARDVPGGRMIVLELARSPAGPRGAGR